MKSHYCYWMLSVFMATAALADVVPQTINHQGVIKVNGVPFNGTGQFKFAILDASGVNVWTNDNSNLTLNGVPNTFEDVTVTDGVYSVILGGAGPGYTMTAIAPTVFNEPDRRLRIWFNDNINGLQQLTPDHALTSSPYSQHSAFEPPIGSIIAWHKNLAGVPTLPDGWVECNGQVLVDSQSPLNSQTIPNLNIVVGYAGGRFLRGGTTSGVVQDATDVWDPHNTNFHGSENLVRNHDRDITYPSSGFFTHSNFITVQAFNESIAYESTRPVNMSVVWIMRVK